MKRTTILLALLLALLLTACGGKRIAISIDVPPGDGQGFAYSHEEVSSEKGRLTFSLGEGLGDTEVSLLPVDDTRPPEPFYLTPGMPATVDVEKGKWYKVGVKAQNAGMESMRVYVEVSGGEVRIE